LKKPKILIVGASGFVGKNLALQYAQKECVSILVRPSSDISLFLHHPRIKILYGDLEKDIGLADALDGIGIVIHCAARTMGRSYWEFYRTNTQGTACLIQAMHRMHVHRLLYLSSHAACGPCCDGVPLQEHEKQSPISFYGHSKHLAENLVRQSGLAFTILRPVSVYGPHDKEILTYVKLLNQGICPIVGFGPKYLNLIYVVDLVNIIMKIVEQDHFSGRTYFANDGQCYSLDHIFETIARVLQKNVLRIHIPTSVALFVGLLNDLFLPPDKKLVTRDKIRELACKYWLCSSENINRVFSFRPKYEFEQGITETIKWYRSQGLLE
jgi:dihydroflavonol-4-reductase